jgi:hypothetical protein
MWLFTLMLNLFLSLILVLFQIEKKKKWNKRKEMSRPLYRGLFGGSSFTSGAHNLFNQNHGTNGYKLSKSISFIQNQKGLPFLLLRVGLIPTLLTLKFERKCGKATKIDCLISPLKNYKIPLR